MRDPRPGAPPVIRVCVVALADGRLAPASDFLGRLACVEHWPDNRCIHIYTDQGPAPQPAPATHRRRKEAR